MVKQLIAPLNTPLKRAAAIVLLLSAALLLYRLIEVYGCGYRGAVRQMTCTAGHWFDAVVGNRSTRRYDALRWPTIIALASFALSYAYDIGLGRIVRWVRGTPPEVG